MSCCQQSQNTTKNDVSISLQEHVVNRKRYDQHHDKPITELESVYHLKHAQLIVQWEAVI